MLRPAFDAEKRLLRNTMPRTQIGGFKLLLPDFLELTARPNDSSSIQLLVNGRFNLELTVEIVLGRIDGDAPADFAVNVEQRESAVLLFLFGRIIRDYPPSPAEGLTSNERTVALTLFKRLAPSPYRHPAGEQRCSHCGKVWEWWCLACILTY